MISSTFKKYLAIISIFVLPLILANQYYIDDIGRASVGYTKWGVDGRPVADMLMSLLNMSTRMVDIAPLPLLLSVALLSISLSLYRKYFIGSDKWGVLVPLAFIANPAIISLFSYRFDVFTFSFAITAAFFIFTFRIRNIFIDVIMGSVLVIAVVGTYQAVINIVAILIICEIVKNMSTLIAPLDIIKRTAIRLAQVIIGGIIYAKVILPITFIGEHSTNHPGVSGNIFSTIKLNAESYYNFAATNFYRSNGEYILCISYALCVMLTGVVIFSYLKNFRDSILAWVVAGGAILASVISMPMAMGALLLLEKPLGGVHLYMGASGFYLLLATLLYYASAKIKALSVLVCIPVLYTFLLVYAYGNALQAQEKTNTAVMSEIQHAISKSNLDVDSVIFKGDPPRSDIVKNASLNYPILKYTVIDYFWNWYWGSAYLEMHGIKQKFMPQNKSKDLLLNICNYVVIYKGRYITAHSSDGILMIDFKKNRCN